MGEDTRETKRLRLEPSVEGLQKLYDSQEHADLVITCKNKTWTVHKFWLSVQSEFFQKACDSRSGFKESKESKVDLSEEDHEVVDAFIHTLYHLDYEDYAKDTDFAEPIVLDALLYAFAQKYFVPSLQTLAATRFEERAKTEWQTLAFGDAVAKVYDCTATGTNPLKTMIIEMVKLHTPELFDPVNVSFLPLLSKYVELGKDIAVALAGVRMMGKAYKCPRFKGIMVPGDDRARFSCPLGSNCWGGANTAEWWAQHQIEN